jgi:general secretion pathway protein I
MSGRLLRRLLRQRAFSLLEVMVAIAILGLSLTVILSAQGGLAASNSRAANMVNAANYGRCKMTELEEKLLRLGYPEIDDLRDSQMCCGDDSGKFTCDTRVEKVILPNPPSNSLGDGGAMSIGGSASGSSSAALPPIPGMPPGVDPSALVNPAGGAGLNMDGGAGLGALQGQLSAAGGAGGMLNMVMGMVYPALKPLLETSIRKLSVAVKWKEGPIDREVLLVQYVTNPQRAGFIAGAADGGAPPLGSAAPGATDNAPAPTSTGIGGGGSGIGSGGLK